MILPSLKLKPTLYSFFGWQMFDQKPCPALLTPDHARSGSTQGAQIGSPGRRTEKHQTNPNDLYVLRKNTCVSYSYVFNTKYLLRNTLKSMQIGKVTGTLDTPMTNGICLYDFVCSVFCIIFHVLTELQNMQTKDRQLLQIQICLYPIPLYWLVDTFPYFG